MTSTYKVKIRCMNCDADFNGSDYKNGDTDEILEIKKGNWVSDEECPNCGCKTLTKK